MSKDMRCVVRRYALARAMIREYFRLVGNWEKINGPETNSVNQRLVVAWFDEGLNSPAGALKLVEVQWLSESAHLQKLPVNSDAASGLRSKRPLQNVDILGAHQTVLIASAVYDFATCLQAADLFFEAPPHPPFAAPLLVDSHKELLPQLGQLVKLYLMGARREMGDLMMAQTYCAP